MDRKKYVAQAFSERTSSDQRSWTVDVPGVGSADGPSGEVTADQLADVAVDLIVAETGAAPGTFDVEIVLTQSADLLAPRDHQHLEEFRSRVRTLSDASLKSEQNKAQERRDAAIAAEDRHSASVSQEQIKACETERSRRWIEEDGPQPD